MKTCYIFGAASGEPLDFNKKSDDLVIAADAGFFLCEKLNIEPDILLGDFDSLGYVPNAKEIIKHPVKKDDTDTLLAIRVGFERGYKRFVIYGGAGGRQDHTLANFQTLSFVASNGGIAYLCGDDFTAVAIKDSAIEFSKESAGNISVFSACTECEVSEKNLLYTLNNAKLTFDFPLGVSNEFIGEKAEVSVSRGTALVVWQGPLSWVL